MDRFVDAIGQQESNNPDARNVDTGAFGFSQILPKNWAPWAREAGYQSTPPKTFANQRTITRFKLGQYFLALHDWRKVAVAWYAGPDAAARPWRYDLVRKQGRYPSINAYADSVMRRACA